MKYFFSLLFLLTIHSALFAQGNADYFPQKEDEIVRLSGQLKGNNTDEEKAKISEQIMLILKEVYKTKDGFNYAFSKVKTIGFISSPDEHVKIINWNFEKQDNTNQYYGLIVRYDDKKKMYVQYELLDNNPFAPIPENDYVYGDQWYGALYYKIIPNTASKKTTYTLLGYDANNKTSHIKLIDELAFVGSKVKFGAPIFAIKKKSQKRVIFEHSKKSYMSLKYEEDRNRIVFDHLSPENPIMADFREFYVPDMSYDALVFENEKWVLQEDIVAINPEKNKKGGTVTVYDLSKKGELVGSEQKDAWINPADRNTNGGNVHASALPEPIKSDKKSRKKPNALISEKPIRAKKRSNVDSYYLNILKNNGKKMKKDNKTSKKTKIKK